MGCTSLTNKTNKQINNLSIFQANMSSMYNSAPKKKNDDDCYSIAGMDESKLVVCKRGTAGGRTATQEVARMYKVHNYLLGKGAFGRVYLAESKMNRESKYAIKIVPLKSISEPTKKQLEEELAILNKLDHPYVAKYERAFQDENYIYIIMTLITGQVLLNEMEEKGKFEEADAAHLFWKILSGISHIHSCNVIHRDIKPENIMIDENKEPIIIDFGLSKDASDPCMVLQ